MKKDSARKIVEDLAKQMPCEAAGKFHNDGRDSLECVPLARAYKKLGIEPQEFCLGCRARRLLKAGKKLGRG